MTTSTKSTTKQHIDQLLAVLSEKTTNQQRLHRGVIQLMTYHIQDKYVAELKAKSTDTSYMSGITNALTLSTPDEAILNAVSRGNDYLEAIRDDVSVDPAFKDIYDEMLQYMYTTHRYASFCIKRIVIHDLTDHKDSDASLIAQTVFHNFD